jgi:hypothetical protein
MRGMGRQLAFGVLLTLSIGVGAIAQLPQPIPFPPEPLPSKGSQPGVREQLKADLAALLGDRKDIGADDGAMNERARLQSQLRDLLNRINAPRSSPGPAINPTIAPKPAPVYPPESKSIDPIREGMNRFRDNDFDVAFAVFRMIDPGPLTREDRAFVQYMKACCLRRLNKPNEAAIIYRELADAHDDDFTTECAIWQLSLIRSAQELETQLEQLRSRTKSR